MDNERKRPRMDDQYNYQPSPVIHVSCFPENTLERDFLSLFQPYGPIREITIMPEKKQCLIEFKNLPDAEKVVSRSSTEPFNVGANALRISFSTSKRIMYRGWDKDEMLEAPGESLENNVLLFTFYSVNYPVTVDFIHRIVSPFGQILRVVIFRKNQTQAMVEMQDLTDSRNVKQNLNGADIGPGCCLLKIDYGRPHYLSVTKNDQDTWDFENNGLPPHNAPDNRASFPDTDAGYNYPYLPNHNQQHPSYRRNHNAGFDYNAPYGGDYPDPCGPPMGHGMHYPHTRQAHGGGSGSRRSFRSSPTTVAMIHNLDMERINCDRLFNLFCLYGNVIRVKFLRSNPGSAMIQLGDPMSVERAISNLSGYKFMDEQIMIRPSKQESILDVSQPYKLSDGTFSFKDFSDSRNNRYLTAEMANKNRKYRPSRALHYWNCPLDFNIEQMGEICKLYGAPPPAKMVPFPVLKGKSSSGILQWCNEDQALVNLACCNHHIITHPEGLYSFVLKLSFANPLVEDRTKPAAENTSHKPIESTDGDSHPQTANSEEVQKDPQSSDIDGHSLDSQPVSAEPVTYEELPVSSTDSG